MDESSSAFPKSARCAEGSAWVVLRVVLGVGCAVLGAACCVCVVC